MFIVFTVVEGRDSLGNTHELEVLV